MNLFTNLVHRMKITEVHIRKDEKPWARKDGESRIVNAKIYAENISCIYVF